MMARKKGDPRTALVKSYFTPEEKQHIQATATRLHLSTSDFIRNVLMNTRLPQPERVEAIRELCRLRADMARLGNLFLLAMDKPGYPIPQLRTDLAEIRSLTQQIKDKVMSL